MADAGELRSGRRAALAAVTAIGWWLAAPMRQAIPAAPVVRELDLGSFDRLVLQVPADVEITLGDRNHARIEAEPKVIDSIDFRDRNGRLQVIAGRNFQTQERIYIRITCRRLVALEAHAAVDATVSGLRGDAFSLSAADSASVSLEGMNLTALDADIAGSATVTASGKVRTQKVRVAGAGGYDARQLESRRSVVDASGSSDVIIDSREQLEATVSGAATVQYKGTPALKQSVSGAGTIERQ